MMSFSTLYFRSNIVVLTMGFLHSKYLMSCDKIMITHGQQLTWLWQPPTQSYLTLHSCRTRVVVLSSRHISPWTLTSTMSDTSSECPGCSYVHVTTFVSWNDKEGVTELWSLYGTFISFYILSFVINPKSFMLLERKKLILKFQ